MFCHVAKENVLGVHDCQSVYHVPLLLNDQKMMHVIMNRLKLQPHCKQIENSLFIKWNQMTLRQERLFDTVTIVLVGKYTHLHDSYLSVTKSLEHASMACNRKLDLKVFFINIDTVVGRSV
jgi:CTP synthase